MCAVSMIMDHYGDKWFERIHTEPTVHAAPHTRPVSDDEINEFRKLLERAREYDRKNNQPDCELEGKRQRIRDLAKELGVEVDFV